MNSLFLLLGRLLLGGFFLFNGVHHFVRVSALSAFAAAKGVPAPMAAVLVGGVLLLIGGVSLLLGMAPRVGIIAILLFMVPVTVVMHGFWMEQGMMRAIDLTNFTKNVAIIGAVLMLLAVPEPWPYSAEASRARFRREAGAH
jgi:putative oxidoreductase